MISPCESATRTAPCEPNYQDESNVALLELQHPVEANWQAADASDADLVTQMFDPQNLRWKQVDWVVLGWMAVMHAGAIAAPFFFSWSALVLVAVLHWMTCSWGVCLTYHRCISHKSLRLVGPVKFLMILCGIMSGEGTPLTWAATHRVHHQKSDKPGDPHSPVNGLGWSHILWLFVRHRPEEREALFRRYCPDLMKDRMLVFFERTYMAWLVAGGVVLYSLGGWSWLLWGLCFRIVLGYHTTWLINSATHVWGYKNYETTDDSRNLWWVALLAYGEGWHNNHHAHPRIANYGHRWWELDLTWLSICVLRFLGLAREVDDRLPQRAA